MEYPMILIFIAVFFPLISALSTSFFSFKKPSDLPKTITTTLMAISALSSFFIFKNVLIDKNFYRIILFDFIKIFDFESKFTIKLDSLSASMLLLVNFVSACVHFYSLSYMKEDPAINRFLTYLSMFTFFMIILIMSDDLLQLFIGWEGVGVSSYALISFWFKKDSASSAANKAFIVNRVGDFGLIIGICLCYFVFKTINITEISKILPEHIDHSISFLGMDFQTINLICLFIFIGCMGKSAQLGLHVWLPDAMEGPTPVSALIHAATMVTAGIFLVARFFFLFDLSDIKYLIFIVSGLTAIFAASVACFQTDIKKIIAYSTCSQLAYMFLGCAAGGYNASIFHLLTHGFFKALLFLGAGSVIHGTNEQNINKLPKSLFKNMPYTFVLMFLGTLAITGIPPFSGFYSKDAIIEYLGQATGQNPFGQHINSIFINFSIKFAYFSALITVFITAFYSWKLIFKSFFNNNEITSENQTPHESDFKILLPMTLLAVFAFSSGFILKNALKILESSNIYWGNSLFSDGLSHYAHNIFVQYLPLIISILGGIFAYYIFMVLNKNQSKDQDNKSIFVKILENKFYFDEIYNKIFVQSLKKLSCLFAFFDKEIFDRFFVNNFRNIAYYIGKRISYAHNGFLYRYALWQISATFLFLLYIFLKK